MNDNGTYICEAKNLMGIKKRRVILVVNGEYVTMFVYILTISHDS